MTAALISVYYPSELNLKGIQRISSQTDLTVICDNSSSDNSALFAGLQNCIYHGNMANIGLSKAFNAALKDCSASWKDDDFVIFFDQDSVIEDGYIKKLTDEYLSVESAFPALGCLGPVFFNTSRDALESPRMKRFMTSRSYRVNNVITSSLLTRYGSIRKIGFWNENLFLDFADWDLCWRLQSHGMLCAITDAVVLRHSIGIKEKKAGPVHLRVGHTVREYYQTRDALYLLEKDYVPLKMRFRLLANLTVRPLAHFLFLNDKKERMRYVFRGFSDYKRNIHGEYTE